MTMFESLSVKDKWYIIFADLSLIMYIFGHSTEFGTLPFPDKLFYYPCAVSLIIAISSKSYWRFSRADIYQIIFWLAAILNSSLQTYFEAETIANGLIGFMIFRHVSNIRIKPLILLLFFLTPAVVLIHYLFSNPLGLSSGYRYGGFQGDPNCFSFAINILIYASGYVANYEKNVKYKVLAIVNIICLVPLLLAAASRAGIAIMIAIVGYAFKDTIKRNPSIAFIIIVSGLLLGGRVINKFSSQINLITDRYTETSQKGDYRTQELSIVPNVLMNHPQYILFGIGYSGSLYAHDRFPDEYYHEGRSHNSYMSTLLEEGLIGFILFMSYLICKYKVAWKNRFTVDGYYKLILLLTTLFFFYTIYCLPFLPFWYAINLASNNKLS